MFVVDNRINKVYSLGVCKICNEWHISNFLNNVNFNKHKQVLLMLGREEKNISYSLIRYKSSCNEGIENIYYYKRGDIALSNVA